MRQMDKNARRFINHNKRVWRDWKINNASGLILFDYYPLAETEIARSYLLNTLAKKYCAQIASFSMRKSNTIEWDEIYRSYNVENHVLVNLSAEQRERSQSIFNEVFPKIETKRDVFDLNVLGVWIGVDIYEEYLMRHTEPTIIVDDPRLEKIIREGIDALVFWIDFYQNNDVKAIVSSHIGVRIEKNLTCKIAGALFNIPFYSTHARSVTYYPEPHLYFKEVARHYMTYHDRFKQLSKDIQKQAISWARDRMQKRLTGEVGVDMPYSTKSAFSMDGDNKSIVKDSDKIKVLVCTHEFYDSPNCYGGLLFMDFYEWLIYLGDISKKTDYDWYVKTHPDVLPMSKEIIEKIVTDYPRFKLIPPETSFHQLASEGIEFVLTCYGSVGHECPLLGMQVINAGNNPHMGYDFNWNPKTLEEYERLLMNLGSLEKETNLKDIYEFYYMHYKGVGIIDDWIYLSYKNMLVDLTEKERFGFDIFPYFLDQLTRERHHHMISRFTDYINSGKIGSATLLDFGQKDSTMK